jgi:5-enolpyruvylshikimate-3-phosphate synthase
MSLSGKNGKINYRVSVKAHEGKFRVFVETRGQLSGTGMPMGELDTIDQASTVAAFLVTAFHDCEVQGINEAYDRALAIIGKRDE